MTTRDIGDEGFRWFFGFVEDIIDPDELGQVKVRIPNIHGDMPKEDLPWATVVTPVTSASSLEVGVSPLGLKVGSMVFGFFADGREYNIPVILGSINKINDGDKSRHDVSRLARGTNSIVKKPLGPEPESAYKAKYPFNKTYTTESGHAIEIDDTPGQERIHLYHKTGTYVEINKDGRMVTRVEGDDYEINVKNKELFVSGNMKVTVNGNVDIRVNGTYTVTSGGNMLFKAPRIDFN
jgi:hypothetical protein